MKRHFLLFAILAIFALSLIIDSTSKFPLRLGLDLQGGTQLILQAQMEKIPLSDQDQALESAREIIEKRVNLFGVSESLVQTSKVGSERRILVELPGLKDASAAANLVGQTAQLEFREEATPSSILTGADLKKTQVSFGTAEGGRSGPQVTIEFTVKGAEKFAELTKRNLNKPLAIFLDDQLISAPVVQQEIVGGSAVITGQFTTEEAKNLSIQLNAGALPVPIKILEERRVGPSLGQEAVNKSLVAAIVGLLIVAAYMVTLYGKLGLVADGALVLYILVILAIFKTGLFILPPVTLTLAGVAGFVLSVGMAVDANILIFERMKEEIRWGKTKSMALELGFARAWTSIWASNVSSLLTAGILYYFGTSIIRGFAITLSIGVLVSMFTAIVVTRTILRYVIHK
ncbi:protein translocase subunit SecD [Candidatus Daviesbacteria bacterium]|nr:protein translocase subunit SecD [Candidatus Daviesbacteria bacterium]